MSSPPEITLKNLNGQWVMNRKFSSDYDPVLKLQGVSWLMRKVLNMAAVFLTLKEWEEGGHTHIHVENKPASGLPPTTEDRVFDGEGAEVAHPLFGRVCSKTSWATVEDLEEIDPYLADGFDKGEKGARLVHIETEHLDNGVLTHQAWGFEEVEGQRFQSRHVVVKKGQQIVRVRLVYDYLGPAAC